MPNEAASFLVVTEDQAETDHYRDGIVANDGQESACGWWTIHRIDVAAIDTARRGEAA